MRCSKTWATASGSLSSPSPRARAALRSLLPFYWDWSTNLYLENAAGNTLRTLPLGLSLPELLPGQEQTVSVTLEGVRLSLSGKNGGQKLTLGIVDPMTGRDAVRFAMKTKIRNGRAVLI